MYNLEAQFRNFTQVVQLAASKTEFLDEKGKIMKNILYSTLLNRELKFQDCRDVAHLLQTATVRIQCETVAEGMGSVLAEHMEHCGSLSQDRLYR